jgi:uncharacterized membrane protein
MMVREESEVAAMSLVPCFPLFALLTGLLLLAASLTPSLIPRGHVLQSVPGGVVLALGYAIPYRRYSCDFR